MIALIAIVLGVCVIAAIVYCDWPIWILLIPAAIGGWAEYLHDCLED
jgi:hypothetical protein